jgi:hypothetical protein
VGAWGYGIRTPAIPLGSEPPTTPPLRTYNKNTFIDWPTAQNREGKTVPIGRVTLLPGDWFTVSSGGRTVRQNWICVGRDRYFGHGVARNFTMSGDVGPMSELKAKYDVENVRKWIDAAHVQGVISPPAGGGGAGGTDG